MDTVHGLLRLAEMRGLIERFRSESTEHARIAQSDLFGIENGYRRSRVAWKPCRIRKYSTSSASRRPELRDFVDADPARKTKYGAAWDAIAKAQATYRDIEISYQFMEGRNGFFTKYFAFARALVRGADERKKPNAERLREFTESRIPSLTQQLFSTAPIYPEYEKVKLAFSLTKLREWLGADDAFVKAVLGTQSPQALAEQLIDGTKLGDPAVRKQLWTVVVPQWMRPTIIHCAGASHRPAGTRHPQAHGRRSRIRRRQELRTDRCRTLREVRHQRLSGRDLYRTISFGEVKGWEEKGKWIKPFTDIAGAFARATGFEPFALPQSWLDAKASLNMDQRLDFVTTNDIIGGNSGSPMINRDARSWVSCSTAISSRWVGDYWFDERVNRTVAVHSGAILEALHKVYKQTASRTRSKPRASTRLRG